MDAEASPPRSISSHLRGALSACRGAWAHAARLALDIALPTLCVACREPVDGEGVCAACWAKLSFIAPPFCPRLGIPFVYDPGPGLLSMEAIADPPAYQRARAAVRYDDVARTLVHALKYQDRTDLAPRWAAGWRGPGANCSRRPTCWFRCRCTGGAAGAAATTSPARWRARSRQSGVKVASEALRRAADRAADRAVAAAARQQRAGRVQGRPDRRPIFRAAAWC
jgi:hypothetical protein